MRPVRDIVVIRNVEMPGRSKLILPQTANVQFRLGEVVAIGDGRMTDAAIHPLVVAIGDKVMYRAEYAAEMQVNGEKLYVISEQFISVIFDPGEADGLVVS